MVIPGWLAKTGVPASWHQVGGHVAYRDRLRTIGSRTGQATHTGPTANQRLRQNYGPRWGYCHQRCQTSLTPNEKGRVLVQCGWTSTQPLRRLLQLSNGMPDFFLCSLALWPVRAIAALIIGSETRACNEGGDRQIVPSLAGQRRVRNKGTSLGRALERRLDMSAPRLELFWTSRARHEASLRSSVAISQRHLMTINVTPSKRRPVGDILQRRRPSSLPPQFKRFQWTVAPPMVALLMPSRIRKFMKSGRSGWRSATQWHALTRKLHYTLPRP